MRFSLIISWYICRRFCAAFFGALGVIMGLIYLFDVVELMRRAATHGEAGLSVILEMALFKLPNMVQVILPFAIMIGAMVVFWNMTRSRELGGDPFGRHLGLAVPHPCFAGGAG